MDTDIHLGHISLGTVIALLAVLDLQDYDGRLHTTCKAFKYQYKSLSMEVAT